MADLNGPWDVVVVGAGILGLATARELLRREPGARVLVLEREPFVAAHQTGHNSGVIHAGIYYTPGSLKARLCREGQQALYRYLDEQEIPYERCGKLIVAVDESELAGLDELERRGRANGVAGLRRLGASELRDVEPYATGVAALHSPSTGIVDYTVVARALAREIASLGAVVETGVSVARVGRWEPSGPVLAAAAPGGGAGPGVGGASPAGGGVAARDRSLVLVETDRGTIPARRVVACAGAWSDRLAVASEADEDPRIVPFRGGYLRLRPRARHLVKTLIYPVPDPDLPFLGVHLTRRIDGDVWLGPSALLAPSRESYNLTTLRRGDLRDTLRWPGTWRMARRWWRTGVSELYLAASRRAFVEACARYVPTLTRADVEDGPAGIRAQAVGRDGKLLDDFAFAGGDGVLHVRNAPSPAATSSLAIARVIADRLGEA